MLDFYIAKDDQTKQTYKEKLEREFAGGLDSKTFSNLQSKGIIDKRFDFYSDFRLSRLQITKIRDIISQRQLEADSDVLQFSEIIEKAESRQSGLIAYGD
jgi:hypothetical protein